MSIIGLIKKIPIGQQAERGFWLYSRVPQGIFQRLEEASFRKTIDYAYHHSKFYREKFDSLSINPKKILKPEDLKDFHTTPEDIRNHAEDFICMRPDTAFETTGTTSKKTKRVYYSRNEVEEAGWAGAVGLWALGIRKEDRVASAFDYSFWVSGPVLQSSCNVLGCFHVEAGRIDPNEFYDRLRDYGISVVVGDPSWIVRFSEVAEKRGPWPLKLLLAGGENLTEAARHYVEEIWQTDFILNYGQTEAFGAIGMESREKKGYHINEFHNYFEIINKDDAGYGELVYTTLNRRVMPLIRYRSGDITRFVNGISKSNFPGRRIEKIKGRVDEWTVTAMGNIAPWMFEDLFDSIREISKDWQIEVQKTGNKDLITFHVEKALVQISDQDLIEKILSALRKEMPESFRVQGMGLFDFDLKIHSKGSLRTNRKLKRVVDLRKF